MQIVFLLERSPTNREYDRFGVELLRARHDANVRFWDLSQIIHPGSSAAHPFGEGSLTRVFESTAEACEAVRGLPGNVVVVNLLPFCLRSYAILREMRRRRIASCVVFTNAHPTGAEYYRPSYRLKRILRLSWRQVVDGLLARVRANWVGVDQATFALLGGTASAPGFHPLVGPRTTIVKTHVLDYDIILGLDTHPSAGDEHLGVFIDQFLPFHPDLESEGITSPVDPVRYYADVERLLAVAEAQLHIRVEVAAHPRANEALLIRMLPGRSIVFGRTADLVRRAKIVFMHNSTAVNFAVLFQKPVVFVSTSELQARWPGVHRSTAALAGLLGKAVVMADASRLHDWPMELQVDGVAYDRFRNAYIKEHDTPEEPAWGILATAVRASGLVGR